MSERARRIGRLLDKAWKALSGGGDEEDDRLRRAESQLSYLHKEHEDVLDQIRNIEDKPELSQRDEQRIRELRNILEGLGVEVDQTSSSV